MSIPEIEVIVKEVEALLLGRELSEEVFSAVRKLLNVIESLAVDKREMQTEIERLKKLLEEKKRSKTTCEPGKGSASEAENKKLRPKPETPPGLCRDRRSGKTLEIHERRECPVDRATLPPDAIRYPDEFAVVQGIIIKPNNIEFRREVFYSPSERKFYRGALPPGYEGDFTPELRALIVSLKYCANTTEPKIGEFLENFGVEVSSGSLNNILTGSSPFEGEYHGVLKAGLGTTIYQQTDDTSARVAGQAWHTHIICNPYYSFYSTRSSKDRLLVLAAFQNVEKVGYQLNAATMKLLENELEIPAKWRELVQRLIDQRGGDVVLDDAAMTSQLDEWLKTKCPSVRTSISHAGAIVYYRQQTRVPVIQVLVCDDAGQFKLLTERLSLCWIHAARHFERLSPVAPSHQQALKTFLQQFWQLYRALQAYRDAPSTARAAELRAEFERLFSTRTGYDALDDRIESTAAKQSELLTVLDHPSTPLHNNTSELGARVSARRRDVSLQSFSARGARAMDVFTTLVETCKKVWYSPYEYFRLHFSHDPNAPSLANLIQVQANFG